MLRAADDEEGLLSRAAGGLANGAGGGASGVVKTLLRRPRVFILGVVWETPQVQFPQPATEGFPSELQRHAATHLRCAQVCQATERCWEPERSPTDFCGGTGLQAKDDAIASTVAALRTEVDVGGVFRGVPPGPPHRLRCVCCKPAAFEQCVLGTKHHLLPDPSVCWACAAQAAACARTLHTSSESHQALA